MDRRGLVLLTQLPIPPPGPLPIRGNVPLAAACLKVFADSHGLADAYDIRVFSPALANHLGDQALVEAIAACEPWLVGFSCYVWNIERTLWIAARLKQQRPELKVVLGGPEITADNAWVLAQPHADYAVLGEGEQTFAALLAALRSGPVCEPPIAGLVALPCRVPPETRTPLASLDEIPSPYVQGVLDAADEGLMFLETVRGCAFGCKFCYYPKGRRAQTFLSAERIFADLTHAAAHVAGEVVLLDPALNGRPDFAELLRLLARCNADRRLHYSGELRAERLTPAEVQLLSAAGFAEVEIGLQAIDPQVQRLMGRRTDPAAFVHGANALMAAGVKVRVDLIIGLPGDTVDSVRRSIDFLASSRAYSEVQVFHLSVLPGTAFREESAHLGLVFQDRPPYCVLQTRSLSLEQMAMLMEEAQEAFGVEMDPLPPPVLDFPGDCPNFRAAKMGLSPSERVAMGLSPSAEGPIAVARIDLDRPPYALPPAGRRAQAFTLWFTSADFHARRQAAAALIRRVLDDAPHTTLQVVLAISGKPESITPATLSLLLESCYRTVSYLDRYDSVHPGFLRGAKRLVVLVPAADRPRLGPLWDRQLSEYATVVWQGDAKS